MAGISILKKLLMKQAMKESAPFQHEGIMSISKTLSGNIDAKVKRWVKSAKRQGQDLDKMSEQEIKYLIELNKPKAPKVYSNEEAYEILNRFANQNKRGEVIKADFGKPFAEEIVTVERVITDIKKLEPIEAMKEANRVLKGEGRYKSLSKADREKIAMDESVTDHIFERNIVDETEDFAQGGRTGLSYLLAEDTNERMPFKMGRRAFLKLMGGVGAGIGAAKAGLGSLFKAGKPVAKELTQVPIKNIEGMPAWFKPLVNKVIKEGEEVSGDLERVITHKTKLPESKTDVYVTQDLNTGDVVVDIGMGKHGWTDGHYGQPARLEYKASEVIPLHSPDGSYSKVKHGNKTHTKTPEEFNVEEAEFTGGHPENVKFEESTINKYGEHGSDFSEVERFATGKNTVKSQFGKYEEVDKLPPTKKRSQTEWEQDKAQADAEAYWEEHGDYASGGLAKMLGE
jgi:hypothetical protein